MSAYVVVRCDNCGYEHWDAGDYGSMDWTRRDLSQDGWVNVKSTRTSQFDADYCPACAS